MQRISLFTSDKISKSAVPEVDIRMSCDYISYELFTNLNLVYYLQHYYWVLGTEFCEDVLRAGKTGNRELY